MKGADTMRYLALQPKSMLSYDWNAPPSLPNVRGQHTAVILQLAPEGGKTRLTLHHVGWQSADGANGKEWGAAYKYFDGAWASSCRIFRSALHRAVSDPYAPGLR